MDRASYRATRVLSPRPRTYLYKQRRATLLASLHPFRTGTDDLDIHQYAHPNRREAAVAMVSRLGSRFQGSLFCMLPSSALTRWYSSEEVSLLSSLQATHSNARYTIGIYRL